MSYALYCDGSADQQGFGGWGAVLLEGGEIVWDGHEPLIGTTNNRAELTAAMRGLEKIYDSKPVTVFSDSQYVIKGMSEWISGWIRRDWLTGLGDPVKNKDLWLELQSIAQTRNVTWKWVRGHNGAQFNEIADSLAGTGRQEALEGQHE